VVFALLALEELGSPAAGYAVAVITITVLLSVVVHGVTADQAGAQMPDMPERRLIRRNSPPKGDPPVPGRGWSRPA
jgi:hypothetical protein